MAMAQSGQRRTTNAKKTLTCNKPKNTQKGLTVSTRDPDSSLTSDGYSVNVAGYKWFPRDDFISLQSKQLNFAKKKEEQARTYVDPRDLNIGSSINLS